MEAFGFKEAVLGHYSPRAPLGLPLLAGRLPAAAHGLFASQGVNLSSKQMKTDSGATADCKRCESELTFLRSIGRRRREEGKIHFLLIARADVHMVGSAAGWCDLGKVTRY